MSCMKCVTNYAAQILKRAVEEEKEIIFTKVCATQNVEKNSRSELIGKLPAWYGTNAGEVVACVSHMDLSGVSCICNSKLGIKLTNNSNPWKTISVWGMVEGDSVDSLLYAESDENGSYNHGLVIELPVSLAGGVTDYGSIGGGGGGDDYATLDDLLTLGASVAYDPVTHYVQLKNSEGTLLSFFDASAFIVDGMVENVAIVGSNLVISFNTDSGKQDISIPLTAIFDPSNYLTKAEIQSTYTPTSSLAAVALDGQYSSLLNPPTIGNATLKIKKNSSDSGASFTANATSDVTVDLGISAVGLSGEYSDILNPPTIPTVNNATLKIKKNADDSGASFTANASSDVTVNLGISAVGLSGEYSDLLNKPAIPTVNDATLTIKKSSSEQGVVFSANASSPVTCNLGLADVATSGSYNDLSNKPTIPTVNDATITLKRYAADTGDSFTVNAASGKTIDLDLKTLFYTKAEIDSDYLASAVYDSTTHVLTLTSADGTKVINLTIA